MRQKFSKILQFFTFLLPFIGSGQGQASDCSNQISNYENCMRQKLNVRADFKLDQDFRANLESFQCKLVECLTKNSCQPSSLCLSPTRDVKLPGNFSIQYASGARQQFLMMDVDEARRKMTVCGLDIIQKILGPRVEQCVKSKLNLGPFWNLPVVKADQLAKNLSALILAKNTVYQQEAALREIARQLNVEAGHFCPNTVSRRSAKYCIAETLEAAETRISQPWRSPYANAQDAVLNFCNARDECTASFLNAQCLNTYLNIPSAINNCYDWSKSATETEILAPYLKCVSRQKGFPSFTADTDIVLFKTNTLRKLVNLMREDLQVRRDKFIGNLTEFRTSATDECNPNFALTTADDQLNEKFNVVEVEKDRAYLLLPKDDIEFRRQKRDIDKKTTCSQYTTVRAQVDKQCTDAADKPLSSGVPVSTSNRKQIEILLAAGENAFDEGVVGPTFIVKQNIFALNHPFLKYQELLNVNTPPFRRLTNFGHS